MTLVNTPNLLHPTPWLNRHQPYRYSEDARDEIAAEAEHEPVVKEMA